MALSYETWLKGKALAEKLKDAIGTAAEAGIEAALIEIPVVGWLLAQAVKGGIGYTIDEIVDMIPHEYPSGIGYAAGDTDALNRLLVSQGRPRVDGTALATIRKQEMVETAQKTGAPPSSLSPFISAPFGRPDAAQPIPRMNRRAIRRATARQRRILLQAPAQNPFSPGVIVPGRIPNRQISGI